LASLGKVNMRLVMIEPFKVDNAIEFTLVPQGDAGAELRQTDACAAGTWVHVWAWV
jgi:hypothetical protein